jgi:hypothetical protein
VLSLGPDGARARYLGSQDIKTLEGARATRDIADLRIARGTPGVTVASRA